MRVRFYVTDNIDSLTPLNSTYRKHQAMTTTFCGLKDELDPVFLLLPKGHSRTHLPVMSPDLILNKEVSGY